MEKRALAFLYLALFALAISAGTALADLGVCINPAAGQNNVCKETAVDSSQCCPNQAANRNYYFGPTNPTGPNDFNDCMENYFFKDKNSLQVSQCRLGCCCTIFGGDDSAKVKPLCVGNNFIEGDIECGQCPVPACNNQTDDDGDGCSDLNDGGCSSASDNTEEGGICLGSGIGCGNSNYVPRISGFSAAPVKGEKKIRLVWNDECSGNAVKYDIYRCKGESCKNFALIGTTASSTFTDQSNDLLFVTPYRYNVTATYNIQSARPSSVATASPGDLECWSQFSGNNFCVSRYYYYPYKQYIISGSNGAVTEQNFDSKLAEMFSNKFNAAYVCTPDNRLTPPVMQACPAQQICIVDSANNPKCLGPSECKFPEANPFELYGTKDICEGGTTEPPRERNYCFFDKSTTIPNSCYACSQRMPCYDYKTQTSCQSDNCGVQNCTWISTSAELGTGVCISKTKDNCDWCDKQGSGFVESSRAYSSVFDLCTLQKSNALSTEKLKCYFNGVKALSCKDVVCTDYKASDCGAGIELNNDNTLKTGSSDRCGINVCQNFGGTCRKNADGDANADCAATDIPCEKDIFPPNTTLIPVIEKGVYKSLIVNIIDRKSGSSTESLQTGAGYRTFLCIDKPSDPCSGKKPPYSTSTTNRTLTILNRNLYDHGPGGSPRVVLVLNEGDSTMHYYSQDASKNVERVKELTITAHDGTSGPAIFMITIEGATKVNDVYYTKNRNPKVEVEFYEDARITRIIMTSTVSAPISPNFNDVLAKKFTFQAPSQLQNGAYNLELSAKNLQGIFMDGTEIIKIVIDDSIPQLLSIAPNSTKIETSSDISIKARFNKQVNLELSVSDGENITDVASLATDDHKEFRKVMRISDGNKRFIIKATDYAGNVLETTSNFVVNAKPLAISLAKPPYGVAASFTFDLFVKTDNNAECRQKLDIDLPYASMESFSSTGGTIHSTPSYNKIASGDRSEHTLYVKCKDSFRNEEKKAELKIRVDPDRPKIITAFADPNPVVDIDLNTTLSVQTDKEAVCRYSLSKSNFSQMEGEFPGYRQKIFGISNHKAISLEDKKDYKIYISCMARNELLSDVREISVKSDLSIPLSIKSLTPAMASSKSIDLIVSTNKASNCYLINDPLGSEGKYHSKKVNVFPGKNTFNVQCFAGQEKADTKIEVLVDDTPPVMVFVNDNSTLKDNPEFAWQTDKLRAWWLGKENESAISILFYNYTIIEAGTLKPVVGWTVAAKESDAGFNWYPKDGILNITNELKYIFRVMAKNIVGLPSAIMDSDGVTINTALKPASCSNNETDGTETDRNCGGICDRCGIGKACKASSDCGSGFCNPSSNKCAATKCDDGNINGAETDTDFGGGVCGKCNSGKACREDSDCASNSCEFGLCKANLCKDGVLSEGESDVDCGIACSAKCDAGKACKDSRDCTEGTKCVELKCRQCADNDEDCNGVEDSRENDIDGDSCPDDWELRYGLSPNDPNDCSRDDDNDGLTNMNEYTYKTDPNNEDTDGDGYTDKDEIDRGSDPLDPNDVPKSKLGLILLLILLLVLLGAGGYFGYMYYDRNYRKKPIAQQQILQQRRQAHPMQRQAIEEQMKKRHEQIKALEKKRDEEKKKAREGIFSVFGKTEAKGDKSDKKTATDKGIGTDSSAAKEPKPAQSAQSNDSAKKDPIKELSSLISSGKQEPKEIAMIKSHVLSLDSAGKDDVMGRLRTITENHKNQKITREDVFTDLRKIVTERKQKSPAKFIEVSRKLSQKRKK
ncbi:hypothetical protein J4212_00975 [Candidatus Woesearchaeota archaeon]|nr:hypothetical protein [Candidatus Woesearchaeota archaeon]